MEFLLLLKYIFSDTFAGYWLWLLVICGNAFYGLIYVYFIGLNYTIAYTHLLPSSVSVQHRVA